MPTAPHSPASGSPASYVARWGYRDPIVARRYHRRRYRGIGGRLRSFFVTSGIQRALALEGVRAGRVLDIPCGTGVASNALAATGSVRSIGVDISAEMIAVARGLSASPRPSMWVCGDIERLPFRENVVTAVVCLRFFAHLPISRWEPVLAALATLTSGPIVIGLPMRESSKHQWRAFKRWLGVNAKQRPIFRLASIEPTVERAGLCVRGKVWQSPFTDTALLVLGHRPAAHRSVAGGNRTGS